jgi:hypothetical protein
MRIAAAMADLLLEGVLQPTVTILDEAIGDAVPGGVRFKAVAPGNGHPTRWMAVPQLSAIGCRNLIERAFEIQLRHRATAEMCPGANIVMPPRV